MAIKIPMDIFMDKDTKKEMTNNCVLSVDCEDKFTRLKRQAKEKTEDAAMKAKRKASLLQRIKSFMGI